MKKFVIAYLSFFNNELKMEVIESNSDIDALKKTSLFGDWEIPDDWTVEDIKNAVFDSDAVVSVIEV